MDGLKISATSKIAVAVCSEVPRKLDKMLLILISKKVVFGALPAIAFARNVFPVCQKNYDD